MSLGGPSRTSRHSQPLKALGWPEWAILRPWLSRKKGTRTHSNIDRSSQELAEALKALSKALSKPYHSTQQGTDDNDDDDDAFYFSRGACEGLAIPAHASGLRGSNALEGLEGLECPRTTEGP